MEEDILDFYEKQNRAEVVKIVDDFTLFDDDLMSRVFDNNIQATELFLNIILDRKINVISVVGQDEMKNPIVGKRNIILDVHAIDEIGQEIDIEVQGNANGAHVKRARLHSAMVDSRMLKEGQDFKDLKDSYIIFMYKNDKFGQGLPIYHIDRCIYETKEPFADGSHIIYVNGRYTGEDAIGKLVSDFHQKESDKMYYKELADGVRHYKEKAEENDNMCEAVEKYAERWAEKKAIKVNMNNLINIMKNLNLSLEQALDALEMQGDERKEMEQLMKGKL